MNKTIDLLIIENNKLLSDYIKLALRRADDIKIIGSVSNGEDALKYLNEHTPDILLLDIIMPKMDGLEFLKQLTYKNKENKIKIIVLSSVGESSIIKSAIDLGADYYILKPFDSDLLINRIRSLFEEDCSFFLQSNENLQNNSINFNKRVVYPYEIEMKITEILNNLQIPSKNIGYGYLRTAIIESYLDTGAQIPLSKKLYPKLSKQYNVTSKKIERSIRNSIGYIWKNGHIQASPIFFDNIYKSGGKKPSNSQFISILVKILKISFE
jgi:two-component system response regulator (stage 0 sporulation protein A)